MNKIYVVGLGPGAQDQITPKAKEALKNSDVIAGYTVYVDLIRDEFEDKKFIATPMKKESERCKLAILEALKGQSVSMVCSGDAGVYGMAGLMYEMAEKLECLDKLEISVIAGITAACSGAALLGAPLIHDFVLISLSDLLTPWELIERRLEAAAMADFSIVLYNPSSVKRHDYLQKACEIILRHRSENNVAGYVENIGRTGEIATVTDLKTLKNTKVNMFTTVFIGNSKTKNIGGKMVTPRGYKEVDA